MTDAVIAAKVTEAVQGGLEAAAIERELLACLKDAHADCPGYEVSPAHDCHGDEEACRHRCPVEERTECPTCALIARAGARQ